MSPCLQSLPELEPVGLVQDGLHRDEALSGDAGYLVRHDRNQRSPGREMLKSVNS